MKQSMGLQALAAVSQHAGMMEAFELLRKYNLFADEMPLLALRAYAERSNALEDKWSAVVEGSVASAAASAKVCLPPPPATTTTHTHTILLLLVWSLLRSLCSRAWRTSLPRRCR
jgi:hypothetical protein